MKLKNQDSFRILDANLNRALEGIRVCEDVVRFSLNSYNGFRRLRSLRHDLAHVTGNESISSAKLISARSIRTDVGRRTKSTEESSLERLLVINFQRVKESLRVLEEVSRVVDYRKSFSFQKLRFRTYDIEREILCALAALLHR